MRATLIRRRHRAALTCSALSHVPPSNRKRIYLDKVDSRIHARAHTFANVDPVTMSTGSLRFVDLGQRQGFHEADRCPQPCPRWDSARGIACLSERQRCAILHHQSYEVVAHEVGHGTTSFVGGGDGTTRAQSTLTFGPSDERAYDDRLRQHV
jgi:hypothetical protein